ncbi:MAG: CBS domain-containing protein [Desulfurococcales archaeon]|nr:CBS domain-containing protein [Desulfurococcales archaeon]
MDPRPLSVPPSSSAATVRRIMRETGARVVLVAHEAMLDGWIPRRLALLVTSRKTTATARDIMEDPPVIVSPSESVASALESMLRVDEWYAPVVGNGMIAGLLGLEHVIAEHLRLNPGHLASIRLDEVMSRDPLTASPDDFIASIWRIMVERKYAGLPVVDDRGRLVGIITQYDLLRKGYARVELTSEAGQHRGPRVREAMTYTVHYLYPWSSLEEAARLVAERGYGRIPVVEDEASRRLVGIVDREDIVRAVMGW